MSEDGKYEILYYGELVCPQIGGPWYRREWRKDVTVDEPSLKEESDGISN